MADAKKPAAPIVDVAHPGKTAPSPNSKGVIVTHRPIMPDPMVVAEVSDSDAAAAQESKKPKATGSSASKITIKPLSAPPLQSEADKTAEGNSGKDEKKTTEQPPDKPSPAETKITLKTEKPAAETAEAEADTSSAHAEPPAEKTADKASAAQPKQEVAAPETDSGSADASDAEQEQPPSKPEKPENPLAPVPAVDDEAARQAEHDAAIQKLVDGKKYFLPINSVEKRRTKRVVVLGLLLSLVLALAWLDVALDSGIVKIDGLQPVTHFFSN